MKPVYLEFCGVNSFSERTEIDFRTLLEFGIFGIFGDTGSGKSTVLDCIVFALYGKVSRLDAKEAVIVNLINYGSDRAYVNFEFELEYRNKRRTFRVERELKRKNGSQNVRVYERNGDTLSALAEGVRDGNALIGEIVGLEQKDFEKCIALPQGEFAQFVKSQKSDRLKLISRLFDLEGYGESLVQRTNKRYHGLQNETEILKTRLEPFESVTEEGIKTLTAEIKRLAEEEKRAETALKQAREEEKKISALAEKRKEYEKAKREMARLEEKYETMKSLNAELSRLEKAAACAVALRDFEAAKRKREQDEKSLSDALIKLKAAEERAKALPADDTEKSSAEIERITAMKAAAETAERDRKTAEECRRRLEEIQKEYTAELRNGKEFDYEAEKSAIENNLAKLGEGDFFAFAEEHGKAELLRAEYKTFAGELTSLTEKHPDIGADSKPLIEKYTALSDGVKKDYSDVRAEYEKLEKARKEEREKLVLLEKAAGSHRMHLQRLQQLGEEREKCKKQFDELSARLTEQTVSAAELEKRLLEIRRRQKETGELREKANAALAEANAVKAAAEERAKACSERLADCEKRLRETLTAGGFTDADEAVALSKKYGDPEGAKARVERYKEEYAATKKNLRALETEDYSKAGDESLSAAKSALSGAETAWKTCTAESALRAKELEESKEKIEKKKELSKAYSEKRKETEIYERLKKLLEGNKFMEFVAEEYLQTVALNASERLLSLTDGRYFLRYDGNFLVGDNYNGGMPRGVYTLSGGETFLVSLSLALALSAEICARSLRPIEFFFLDEGFGTLDEKLVDTVMDSLEKLKGEHFSIGIISHVEELRHRIERKLSVKKATERHGSQITME